MLEEQEFLPLSYEAEQSVIGAMLRDKNAVSTAMETLSKEDFYIHQCAFIFEAAKSLYEASKAVDIVTVHEELIQQGHEEIDIQILKDIVMAVPTSANIESYCAIVKDKSILRSLMQAGQDILSDSRSGKKDVETILESSEQRLLGLLQRRSSKAMTSMPDIAMNVLHNVEKASKLTEPITGVPTGFIDLDYRTAGFQKSDFILIAARPSMGKTALALNILSYVSVKKKLPVMMFSLEMSKEQLVSRMLAAETLINSDKIKKGTLDPEEWDGLIRGVDTLSEANLVIDDTPGISVSEVRAKCRRTKMEKGLSMIMIDYLQLMTVSGSKDNRQQEISEISRSLKALAREMDCPVVALSQLSRAVESRNDKRPMMSDLRESGAIEQDADIVMFIYRDDYYNKDSRTPNEAELIIAKHRNGSVGTVNLMWQPQYTRFVNIDNNPFTRKE